MGPFGCKILANLGRDLARTVGQLGDHESAIRLLQELANRAALAYGTDHREVMTLRGDLAHERGESGDVAGALADLSGDSGATSQPAAGTRPQTPYPQSGAAATQYQRP